MLKNTPLLFIGLVAVSAPCLANPSLGLGGYSNTTGPVSNSSNIQSSLSNPASLRQNMPDDTSFRWGFMPNLISVGVEIADIPKADGLKDQVDNDLKFISDKEYESASECSTYQVGDTVTTLINRCIGYVNGKLDSGFNANTLPLLEKVDIRLRASIGLPLTPLLYRASPLSGAWGLSAGAFSQSRMRVLTSNLSVVQNPEETTQVDLKARTDAQADFQFVGVGVLSVTHSLNFDRFAPISFAMDDEDMAHLDGGIRLNYYAIKAGRLSETLVDENGKTGGDDKDPVYNDSATIGVDVGLLWTDVIYQVGGTIYNINAPSFSFPDTMLTGSMKSRALPDSITINRQTVLEGSFYTPNKNLQLQASHALDVGTDFMGEEHQWTTLSVGYYPYSFWIPSLRVGYQKNSVGTKLSRYTFGTTLLGMINVDGYVSPEETADGVPRAFGFSIGLSKQF